MANAKKTWKLYFSLGALVLLLLSGKPLYGQSQQIAATLGGTVSDQQGLAVPAAKVTLTSSELGISRTYTTGAAGLYTFTFLAPGVYTLGAEAPGFKHYVQEGITLEPGQNAQQNVSLLIGAVTQTVEVTSQASLLNTANANIASDISATGVEDLPLSFRSVFMLTLLNSSVTNIPEGMQGTGIGGTADQDVSMINFGGTLFGTAEYLLDGTYDNREDWGGAIYVPSVDDVEEMKIQTNAFTAQYAWSSGNVINIVTKGGTNQFHGDAFEFYRNGLTDARNFFNYGARPTFGRNQFGGTLGGPIQKNKTFFFVYFEGLRQSTPNTVTDTLPTAADRTGNFSALLGTTSIGTDVEGRPIYSGELYNPFGTRAITAGVVDPVTGLTPTASGYIRDPISYSGAINVIPPNLIDAIGSKIATGIYWPLPNLSGLVNNFTATATASEYANEYSVRVDHNFSDNDRAFVRWSQKYEQKTSTPEYFGTADAGGPGLVNPNNRYSIGAGYNHIFSPTFAMNVNLGVNRHVEGGVTQGYGSDKTALGLPAFINAIAPDFPGISVSPYASLGNGGYITPQTLWTQSVDFTNARGKHQLGFGFMHVWLRADGAHWGTTSLGYSNSSTGGPNPQKETTGTGDAFAAFMLGVGSGTDSTSFTALPATDKQFYDGYLHDSWRVTRKLTLNPGLSYDVQTAPTERHNAQNYFDYTAVNPISTALGFSVPGELVFNSPSNRSLYNTPYTNFAPRIGLAYQARDKMVWRAGYGIFYTPNYYGHGQNTGFSQTTTWVTSLNNGLNPSSTLSGNASLGLPSAFPTGELMPSGNSLGALTNVGQSAGGIDRNRPTPYLEQWMAGVQYAFTTNTMLDVNYVGNIGIHLAPASLAYDELTPSDLALGNTLNTMVTNPYFGKITSSACGQSSATIVESQLLRPFPEFCGVSAAQPDAGASSYNALQANFTHRWQSGTRFNVSYTFSKFMSNMEGDNSYFMEGGNGSNFENMYNLRNERSVDVADSPNSLVVNYDYELPFGKGKQFGSSWSRPVNAGLGGWQWSGIVFAKSGFPLTITASSNNNSSDGGSQRPNVVPGVSLVPPNQSIHDWINSAAFAEPNAFTYGDAPRFFSDLRGPGYFDWDMGIMKSWKFTESKRVQFRFEMYNSFNHPNFSFPNTSLSSSAFGTITSARLARTMQFSGKFYF